MYCSPHLVAPATAHPPAHPARSTLWTEVDTEGLEDQCKRLQRELRPFSAGNAAVTRWKAFADTEALVKNMATVIPMIASLHSPAMRDRHWKQLLQTCGAPNAFDPKDPKFSLADLFDLRLHEHSEEVDEIVETARKELKIDKKLSAIEETWASLSLIYEQHKDSDVRVVKAPDEVIEALEAGQLELQTVRGSWGRDGPCRSSQGWVALGGASESRPSLSVWRTRPVCPAALTPAADCGCAQAMSPHPGSHEPAFTPRCHTRSPSLSPSTPPHTHTPLRPATQILGMGRFVDFFRNRVTHWQRTLGTVQSVLSVWLSVTKQWASLESIFLGSADIRSQLPDDTKRFEGIDTDFKDMMRDASATPNVVEACTAEGREELLKNQLVPNLEICQKALNEYLDIKKKIFPRFYFVSNVALLDILSNGEPAAHALRARHSLTHARPTFAPRPLPR